MLLTRCCLIASSFFFFAGFLPPPVKADTPADAQKAIRASYERIEVGLIKGDFQPFADAMAPDCVQIDSQGHAQSIRTITAIMGIKLQPVIAVPSDVTMMGVQSVVGSDGQPELFYQGYSSRSPAALYRQYQSIYGTQAKRKGAHRLPDGAMEYRFHLQINSGATRIDTGFSITDRASQEDYDRAGKDFTARSILHIWVGLPPALVKTYQADHDGIWIPLPSEVTPLSARAVAVAAVQRSIQAIYDRQNAAAARLDSDGMFTGYAPEFISHDLSGSSRTLTQERQVMHQIFTVMRTYLGKVTIQEITVTGETAVVRIVDFSISTFTDPRTQKESNLVDDSVSLDTWKKSGTVWLLTRSKRLSEDAKFNGFPIKK
jgi:hypothetical protein